MAISFHDPSPCGFNLRRLNQFSGGFIWETTIFVPCEAICSPAHIRKPNNRPVVAPDSKLSSLVHIKVDTDNKGMVNLSGTARSQDAVDKAVSIARGVKGVTSVENHIKVVSDQ